MNAKTEELNEVLKQLWLAEKPKVILNYLEVFSNRALPVFDPRLIELTRHPDEKVRWRAFKTLSMNDHPILREHALKELEKGLSDCLNADLFIYNFFPGDEERILKALVLPDDLNQLHWLLSAIEDILEINPSADSSKLGVVIYAHTPCVNCRFKAIKHLARQSAIPSWMKEECRFDSNVECRELLKSMN
ncbi:hypothetical protein KIH39_11985 [Telmatocola sphagniphila]|uniref:Uncharacterized protein n=1 Tax=Telmatocola sphagniphila TaxID=1123043 RepID=A0A8E6BA64_9BACT|nr:hypothetical protein [Telmatocola sphagniphila]QVL34591.1 hypothetical protein KIH39_11985 [Telmatocola sphagniphila]